MKSVSAFANGLGGSLFFGIDNDGIVKGLDDVQHVCEAISSRIRDYMDSEAATATLCWITGELSNPTGVENIEAHHAVMITSANGVVTVSGVNDGTTVAVYTADGSMAGQATANNNTATITTNIEKGTVAIIKIGDKAIKIVMK